MSLWVQTAKHGDLLSVLPMLHHEFIETGIKPDLLVSKPYRQIPESLSYVNTIIYDGDNQDLDGAIKLAKHRSNKVKVTQLHGKGFKFEHRHPSFQYDQWDRAGMLHKWGKLPLVLPRTNNLLIWKLGLQESPTKSPRPRFIIFADHSQSSPFPHKEELAKALIDNFPSHQIVRLSSVRASHLLDLLALMDGAELIVTVETMHLHLSAACKTPVIALVTDKPSRWHGSAYHPRLALHCRYGDFQRRKQEIIRVAQNAIDKNPSPTTLNCDLSNKHGYNLGMIWHGGVLITTHRFHPKRDWKTRLSIHDGVITSDIIFPKELDDFSQEDCRLFHHAGKLMASYVLATTEPVSKIFKCVVGYGELVQKDGRWHIGKHFQPVFRGNDFSSLVKNWCPFEHDGKIHFIWGNHSGEQIVIQVGDDKVVQEFKTPEPKWEYGEIRGGAIVRYRDKLLRFFHSRTGEGLWGAHGTFQYHVGASLIEPEPPFKTIAVSSHPILSGDERYVPGCFHWKPNCVLVYGAINEPHRPLQISVGRNDSISEIVSLKDGDLNL